MPPPPHSLHRLLIRWCWQMLAPPHSLHVLLRRWCEHRLRGFLFTVSALAAPASSRPFRLRTPLPPAPTASVGPASMPTVVRGEKRAGGETAGLAVSFGIREWRRTGRGGSCSQAFTARRELQPEQRAPRGCEKRKTEGPGAPAPPHQEPGRDVDHVGGNVL